MNTRRSEQKPCYYCNGVGANAIDNIEDEDLANAPSYWEVVVGLQFGLDLGE